MVSRAIYKKSRLPSSNYTSFFLHNLHLEHFRNRRNGSDAVTHLSHVDCTGTRVSSMYVLYVRHLLE